MAQEKINVDRSEPDYQSGGSLAHQLTETVRFNFDGANIEQEGATAEDVSLHRRCSHPHLSDIRFQLEMEDGDMIDGQIWQVGDLRVVGVFSDTHLIIFRRAEIVTLECDSPQCSVIGVSVESPIRGKLASSCAPASRFQPHREADSRHSKNQSRRQSGYGTLGSRAFGTLLPSIPFPTKK